ncbi:hypothetical protein BJY04DRAFT_218082 [Aspergillus karnatakaensis]|uniref:uncharacterized protein n=1 Tax=Aspergillus karnatakaensis TaxID=1810916 RepID=UPI003CCCCB21
MPRGRVYVGPWTDEEKAYFVEIREKFPDLTWEKFRQQYFPGRTQTAVASVWYKINRQKDLARLRALRNRPSSPTQNTLQTTRLSPPQPVQQAEQSAISEDDDEPVDEKERVQGFRNRRGAEPGHDDNNHVAQPTGDGRSRSGSEDCCDIESNHDDNDETSQLANVAESFQVVDGEYDTASDHDDNDSHAERLQKIVREKATLPEPHDAQAERSPRPLTIGALFASRYSSNSKPLYSRNTSIAVSFDTPIRGSTIPLAPQQRPVFTTAGLTSPADPTSSLSTRGKFEMPIQMKVAERLETARDHLNEIIGLLSTQDKWQQDHEERLAKIEARLMGMEEKVNTYKKELDKLASRVHKYKKRVKRLRRE